MLSLSLTLSAADPGQLFPNVLPWLLAIVGLAVVGAIVIMIVRRILRSDSGNDAPGFTLQSLRDLRDQGQISDEEFERAREAMIGRIKRDVQERAAQGKSVDNTETPVAEIDNKQSGPETHDESAPTERDAGDDPARTPDSDKPAS